MESMLAWPQLELATRCLLSDYLLLPIKNQNHPNECIDWKHSTHKYMESQR